MTLNTTYNPTVADGNGTTKEFSYNFNPLAREYLKVSFQINNEWVEQKSGWSATVSENGGVVTFDIAPTTRVAIERDVPEEQPTQYKTSSGFQAEVIEHSFDLLTGMVQKLKDESSRSVKVEVGSNISPDEIVAQVERVYDSIDNIDTVGMDIDNVDSVATNISKVNTIANNINDVKTVAGNINDVKTVAKNIENVNTVATDIMDVVTVAGITEQTKNVSDNMTAVVDVSNNKTNINNVAANITAVNNVSENMADVKNAVQSANDAKLWAVGTIAEKPEGSSKYWAEQAKNAVQTPDASETVKGIVRLATSDEVTAGTNDSAAITPLKLKQKIAQDLTNPSADTVPSTKAVSDESSRIVSIMNNKINEKMNNDASNVTNAAKSTISGWSIPDYNSGITLTFSKVFTNAGESKTMAKSGLFCFEFLAADVISTIYFYVNNHFVGKIGNSKTSVAFWDEINFPVTKGDVVKVTAETVGGFTAAAVESYLFPYKGSMYE